MLEIERKFLVKNSDFIKQSRKRYDIKQGFLNTHPKRTVRVRIADDKGFLTIKGKSNQSGTSRMEWEIEIPVLDADKLLRLCQGNIIDKTRYEVAFENRIFEVDVFHGANKGLVIAEIELNTENEAFEKPDWLGKEVTGNVQYYNSYLSKNPLGKEND